MGDVGECNCESQPWESFPDVLQGVSWPQYARTLMKSKLNNIINDIVEWRRRKGFTTSWEEFPVKCMLIVTEVSEAVEAHRKFVALKDKDEHPDEQYALIQHIGEELADVAIRLFDLSGSLGYDLEKEIVKKMSVNDKRPHKHGKGY